MDPKTLFPLLALVFVAAALWQRVASGRWQGVSRIWLAMAGIFGVAAVWMRVPTG